MPTTNDILQGLNYNSVAEKKVFCSMPLERDGTIHSVEYYFDIIHTASDSDIGDYRKRYIDRGYNCLTYRVNSVQEAVQLCKDICAELKMEFSSSNEIILKNKTDGKGNIYLIIIERPIF